MNTARSATRKPEDLAYEAAYFLRPYGRVTGEIRNVDGGYHIRG